MTSPHRPTRAACRLCRAGHALWAAALAVLCTTHHGAVLGAPARPRRSQPSWLAGEESTGAPQEPGIRLPTALASPNVI